MYPNDPNPLPQPQPEPQPQAPDQASPATPGPASYLDQITPQQTKKFSSTHKKLMMVGAIAMLILIVIIVISSIPKNVTPTARLAARLVATSKLAESSTSKLKSSKIRSTNSNLKMYLTNTIRDITPILKADEININKLDKAATSSESTATIAITLENARLNGVYDRTYAREMAFQLSNLETLMNQVYKSTTNSRLKTLLKDAKTELEPTQQQFADFNIENS